MTPFRLVVAGPDTPVPISLEGTRWIVGRDPASDIQLGDPLVSRRHALLYLEEGRLWVRDLGARNPTLVGDEPLTGERPLAPGDRVQFGSTTAEVVATNELRAHIAHGDTGVAGEGETLVLSRVEDDASEPGLRTLTRLADSLAPVRSAADAALLVLDLLARVLPVRRALCARLGPREALRVIASVDRTEAQRADPVRIARSTISLLRREQAPVCLPDPGAAAGSDPSRMVAPLFTRGTLTGVVYVEHDATSPAFDRGKLDVAACLVRILGSRIETLDRVEHLRHENVDLRRGERTAAFLGDSDAARGLLAQAEALASRSCPVSILGEAGAGKETIALQMHGRAQHPTPGHIRPFVVFDARPVGTTDPAFELFGDEAPGPLHSGKLRAAHEGTLCIRHAEELPRPVQDRLAEALATARAVTEDGICPLATRLVLTTTLGEEEFFGSRLSPSFATAVGTTVLRVPPLRERIEDLPLLAARFLEDIAHEIGTRPARVSPRAMDRLRAHPWPGNVTEFRQVLTNAGILARGKTIYPKQLPRNLGSGWKDRARKVRPTSLPTLEEVEKQHIERVLESVGGNKVMASAVLGIANSTLYQKMKRYAIGR